MSPQSPKKYRGKVIMNVVVCCDDLSLIFSYLS